MAALSIVKLLAQMGSPRLKALFGQDPRRAADWAYVAAAEGLADAQVCYGRMLLEGTGLPKDPVGASSWRGSSWTNCLFSVTGPGGTA